MRFSASRLETYMGCALQAKFKYIDKEPTRQNAKASFGTIMHHVIEQYDLSSTKDVEKAIALFKYLWSEPSKLGVEPEVWPRATTFGGLMGKGIEILREYHDKKKWDKEEILATEHSFLVPFGRHELTGTVDKLSIGKTGKGQTVLRIVDHKSSSRKPSSLQLAMNIQFTIYIYASLQEEFWIGNGPDFPGVPNGKFHYEALKDLPRRGIWHHLMTVQELDAGGRDDEDYMRLYRVCHEIEKANNANVFIPNISFDTCGICDFTKQCPVVIPVTAEELREEEDAWI